MNFCRQNDACSNLANICFRCGDDRDGNDEEEEIQERREKRESLTFLVESTRQLLQFFVAICPTNVCSLCYWLIPILASHCWIFMWHEMIIFICPLQYKLIVMIVAMIVGR